MSGNYAYLLTLSVPARLQNMALFDKSRVQNYYFQVPGTYIISSAHLKFLKLGTKAKCPLKAMKMM